MQLAAFLLSLCASRALAGCAFANTEATALPPNPHTTDLKRRSTYSKEPLYPRDENRTLLGDLRKNITTPIGQTIANILLGTESGQDQIVGIPPSSPAACAADACCIWYNISSELQETYQANQGCGNLARQAIRAGFHDAGTWSAPREAAGDNCCGADGSLVLSNEELNRTENLGLDMIADFMTPLYEKYKDYNVTMADLIQYAGIYATVLCTNGPRVRFFAGRPDSSAHGPVDLMPDVNDSAEHLVELFANKTIISDDLIALIGAHTTAKQFYVNTTDAGEPLDQTPGVWDVFYYDEVLKDPQTDGVFRLPSDAALSTNGLTSARWNSLAMGTQGQWNEAYSTAYVRLSLLGVDGLNEMTECTQTLPRSIQD